MDAYPGEVFKGEVGKVRLNATMTQNVVTYTVEVNTDNSSGKLLPYLTANVKFIVSDRHQVLMVPNAALRWTPQPQQIVSEFRETSLKAGKGGNASPAGKKPAPIHNAVWVPEGDQVRPVYVTRELTDGSFSEVSSPELKEGTLVVVGEVEKTAGNKSPGGSPFTPKFFHRSSTSK